MKERELEERARKLINEMALEKIESAKPLREGMIYRESYKYKKLSKELLAIQMKLEEIKNKDTHSHPFDSLSQLERNMRVWIEDELCYGTIISWENKHKVLIRVEVRRTSDTPDFIDFRKYCIDMECPHFNRIFKVPVKTYRK